MPDGGQLSMEQPEEYESLKSSVHRFAQEVLRPAAVALDRMAKPEDVIAAGSPLYDVFRVAYELGYHTCNLPQEIGGSGLQGVARHIMLEEMGWGSAGLAISLAVASFPFSSAALSGSHRLLEEFVKPFVADQQGALIGCWAISEPEHGSDALSVGTPEFHDRRISGQVTARAEGDEYVINGQKAACVSNGTIATHALTYLTLDRSIGMSGGGMALIPLDLPGVVRGKPLDKLGQRELNQGEIFFDGVRIPEQFMLVGPAMYEAVLARTLAAATCAMAAIFTGTARAAFEQALAYSRQRVQGGKAICEHQLVQRRLFDMFTKIEASRALSRTTMIGNHGGTSSSLENAIAARTFCTEAAFEVAHDALQIFGANGLSKEYGIEKLFRDTRTSLIEDGTNDVLGLIATQQILRHYQSDASNCMQ